MNNLENLYFIVPLNLLASQSVATNNRSWMNFAFYKFICIFEEFCSNDNLKMIWESSENNVFKSKVPFKMSTYQEQPDALPIISGSKSKKFKGRSLFLEAVFCCKNL